jgi:hypothetical protein
MRSPDGIYSKDPAKQKAAMAELRKMLAAEATPEEKQSIREAAGGSPQRVRLTIPDERGLPRVYQEQYEREYPGHEQDFLLAAREDGLDRKLVRELTAVA